MLTMSSILYSSNRLLFFDYCLYHNIFNKPQIIAFGAIGQQESLIVIMETWLLVQ